MDNSVYEQKTDAYSEFGNRRVVDLVVQYLPPGGSVLDIGCASGGLLRAIGTRAGRRVGIEVSVSAAEAAGHHADEVIVGSIDDDIPLGVGAFDVVVCADVLEHTTDPVASLGRAVSWCRPGGRVIVSVPNIAHWSARFKLLRGRWEYEPTGIFDDGHLRFFTGATLQCLLSGGGLQEIRIEPVVPALRGHVPSLARIPKARHVERSWQAIGRRVPGLLGYQLIGTGRKP